MSDTDKSETSTEVEKKKRSPKRLDAETLKQRVKKRQSSDGYRGAPFERIKWDTLRYDEEKRRQVIDIETVDRDGKPDGQVRTIATSDLQHTRHNRELAKQMQRERNNVRRRLKRQEKAKDKPEGKSDTDESKSEDDAEKSEA